MTTPQSTPGPRAECAVAAATDIVEFVHRLGGDVDIAAFDAEGAPAPFGAVIEISPDEVMVHVHPGQVATLVATPAVEEDPAEDQPAREGMHVRH